MCSARAGQLSLSGWWGVSGLSQGSLLWRSLLAPRDGYVHCLGPDTAMSGGHQMIVIQVSCGFLHSKHCPRVPRAALQILGVV